MGWCFILNFVLMFPEILALSDSLGVHVIMSVPLEAFSVIRGIS